MDQNKTSQKEVLHEETLQTLEAMGEVLLRIRRRANSEGFELVNGKFVKKSIINKND